MNIKQLKKFYKQRKKIIKNRLNDFKNIKDKDIFYELCFCLMTPQSNAYKCDECTCILKEKDFKNNDFEISHILQPKTRFYRNKSKYITEAKEKFPIIEKNLKKIKNPLELREFLVINVKGLGYKEASHFLRNIGYRNLAILDRHILKNLQLLGVIDKIPNLNKKNYLEIEQRLLKFSKKIKIPMDELDLLFWSMETGRVFK